LDGSCITSEALSLTEKAWVQELQQKVMSPIDIYISIGGSNISSKSAKKARHLPHLAIAWVITRS
jgi:hypothetical protein